MALKEFKLRYCSFYFLAMSRVQLPRHGEKGENRVSLKDFGFLSVGASLGLVATVVEIPGHGVPER